MGSPEGGTLTSMSVLTSQESLESNDTSKKNTKCSTNGISSENSLVVPIEATSDTGGGKESKIDGSILDGTRSDQPIMPIVAHGSISNAKNLYKSKLDSEKNWTWVDKYPDEVEKAAESQETAKYAVIIRNVKSEDGRKTLEAHSIVVQSPWLKKALDRQILKDYPGVTCEMSRLEFEAPFKPFVHRWAELLKFRKRMDVDHTTKLHIELLYDILRHELNDHIKAFEDYVLNNVITFDHLWMIYQPAGLVILDPSSGCPNACLELQTSEYMEDESGAFLLLNCQCIDWSGKSFGRQTVRIRVYSFRGTKEISSLNAFPLRFYKEKVSHKATLIERGKKFESLSGYHYKTYSGQAITWDREGKEQAIQVSGRIIVDTYAFNCFSPHPMRQVQALNSKDHDLIFDYIYRQDLMGESTLNDSTRKPMEATNTSPKRPEVTRLTPYHQMLCPATVRGYSLKLKKWLEFFVEFVSDITWNSGAFDSLVLPDDHKELILAFSEAQVQHRDDFDDVIQGKGKGVIMLLSGPPGVGKTLTAEAVAEKTQVPLHTISSGDLGSESWKVESRLTKILELVARWNAILLLDECDVFLEKRSLHDLDRNRVVSIFLRTLEYYEGILFMTTNRVTNIDPAFQSRIHISIEYPNLTATSRGQIWRNFLSVSSRKSDFSEEELNQLASLPLNGRQIKNILKTAQLLASRKKVPLNKGFIDTVLAIERQRPELKDA